MEKGLEQTHKAEALFIFPLTIMIRTAAIHNRMQIMDFQLNRWFATGIIGGAFNAHCGAGAISSPVGNYRPDYALLHP